MDLNLSEVSLTQPKTKKYKTKYTQTDEESDFDQNDEIKEISLSPSMPQKSTTTSSSIKYDSLMTKLSELPFILAGWIQLMINLIFVGIVFLLMYKIFVVLQEDVEIKVNELTAEVISEIKQCERKFKENKCELETRLPAMEKKCSEWQVCMDKNPDEVGKARLSARVLGEIVNEFFEPISMKAIFGVISIFVGAILGTNLSFRFARDGMKK